jgi:hypothetical protein
MVISEIYEIENHSLDDISIIKLEQILADWEDDPVCSPHQVQSDAMACALGNIIDRLYSLVSIAKEEAKKSDWLVDSSHIGA